MARPPLYPWSHWFSQLTRAGDRVQLVAGRDFTSAIPSMRGGIHAEARKRAVAVTTTSTPGGDLIVKRVLAKRYRWNNWLDGDWWVIAYRRDFLVTVADMKRTIRRAAKARGMRAEIQTNAEQIRFRAFAGPRPLSELERAQMPEDWCRDDDEFAAYSNMLESRAVRSLATGPQEVPS